MGDANTYSLTPALRLSNSRLLEGTDLEEKPVDPDIASNLPGSSD
jgi:hypothetical protein